MGGRRVGEAPDRPQPGRVSRLGRRRTGRETILLDIGWSSPCSNSYIATSAPRMRQKRIRTRGRVRAATPQSDTGASPFNTERGAPSRLTNCKKVATGASREHKRVDAQAVSWSNHHSAVSSDTLRCSLGFPTVNSSNIRAARRRIALPASLRMTMMTCSSASRA
jgi:hypothetical protein